MTKYVYAGQDAVEETLYAVNAANGNQVKKESREYIYGAKGVDDVISMTLSTYKRVKKVDVVDTTGVYYYSKDQLGSVTSITSSTGTVIEEYTYNEFGKPYRWNSTQNKFTPVNGAKSSIGNTRMFTGREYDREVMLYYNRARYYDANLGRFISRDPIGINDDVNLYSYTKNNPVNFTDRNGTTSKDLGFDIGNENTVRIIYEHGLIGHIKLQVGNEIYTFGAPGDSGLALYANGIKSALFPTRGIFYTESIGEFYFGSGNGKTISTYDLTVTKTQLAVIKSQVDYLKGNPSYYHPLVSSCSTVIWETLGKAGLVVGEYDYSLHTPYEYNEYLSKYSSLFPNGEISNVQTFDIPSEYGTENYNLLREQINSVYGEDLRWLDYYYNS